MSVQLQGLDELQAALLRKAHRKEAIKNTVRLNGSEMERSAMSACPVDTGTLKRDLGTSTEISDFEATVGVHMHYGPYLEFGTRFMNAQPFIGPAFNKQKGKFIQDLERCMK